MSPSSVQDARHFAAAALRARLPLPHRHWQRQTGAAERVRQAALSPICCLRPTPGKSPRVLCVKEGWQRGSHWRRELYLPVRHVLSERF